jgi:protein required for attachment to host cells
MTTWILVANASRAALYGTNADEELQLLAALSHPESRLKSSELSPTEPGHAGKTRGGSPRRTALEANMTPHDVEAQHFAEKLGDRVSDGARRHAFDKLVLVAPPEFLGRLRQHLHGDAKKNLIASIDKDYTLVEPKALREKLASVTG